MDVNTSASKLTKALTGRSLKSLVAAKTAQDERSKVKEAYCAAALCGTREASIEKLLEPPPPPPHQACLHLVSHFCLDAAQDGCTTGSVQPALALQQHPLR